MADKINDKVEEVTADFLDAEDEILAQLEHELAKAYDEGLDAMTKVIKRLEQLPKSATVGDKRVQQILRDAEKAFHFAWSKGAIKIMGPQIKESMYQGVLQGQAYSRLFEDENVQKSP